MQTATSSSTPASPSASSVRRPSAVTTGEATRNRTSWWVSFRSLARARPSGVSDAQLLAQQAVDLGAVRAALRLAHHGPDERPDRLRIAAADALGHVRVRLDHTGDDGGQLVAVAHRAEALALDDLLGVAAVLDEPVEYLAARCARHGAGLHEPGQLGERAGRDVRRGRVGVRLQARDELVLDPGGDHLGFGAVGGGRRGLEVVAGLGPEGELARRVSRQTPVALVALGADGRKLGDG